MNWLASLRLSAWTLAGLAFWLGLGAGALALDPREPGFFSLDSVHLQTWLIGQAGSHPLLAAWLLVLLALVGLLLLNLAICSWLRLFPGQRAGRGRRLLVLAVHVLALIAVCLQGASFFTGVKRSRVRLAPGQTVELGPGQILRLNRVDFAADPALLRLKGKAARRAMGRANFDRQANLATVEVLRGGQSLGQGELRYFQPATLGGWRVFLLGFKLFKGPDGGKVGVVLNLVQSPLWPVFALSYAGLVAGLFWLTAWEIARLRRRTAKEARA